MSFILDDALVDRQGGKQTISALEALQIIERWADSNTTPTPITMFSPVSMFNNKRVFIEPASLQPIEIKNDPVASRSEKSIVSLSVFEA
jgi:hypothetical protein